MFFLQRLWHNTWRYEDIGSFFITIHLSHYIEMKWHIIIAVSWEVIFTSMITFESSNILWINVSNTSWTSRTYKTILFDIRNYSKTKKCILKYIPYLKIYMKNEMTSLPKWEFWNHILLNDKHECIYKKKTCWSECNPFYVEALAHSTGKMNMRIEFRQI